MKKAFIHLLALASYTICGFCTGSYEKNAIENTKQNPSIHLNLQDLPIFSEANNPLTGMYAFNLIPPISLKNIDIQKSVQRVIAMELEKIGEVIHLKDGDMRGFGSGNILLIQIGNVLGWDDSETPVSRISLQVETSVVIHKTGINTFPAVWSVNTFFQGPIDSSSEDKMTKAMQKLVSDFSQNYKYANQGQKKKPVFYTYY